jgi:hypothetical protein
MKPRKALVPHLTDRTMTIWEPACGSGKMVRALEESFVHVVATDIDQGKDFLDYTTAENFDAIITNPPYNQAYAFVLHAIRLMEPKRGVVAMLLRTDWDHAKGRNFLFTELPFWKKIALTKRIQWFEGTNGSPSFNHAWFVWDWKHQGPATLAYGP